MVPSNVVYLSHNGLGDNLISIGALHYLLNFYQNVFFLCKDVYHENIKMFFLDEPRIQCVPIDSKNEEQSCIQTIQPAYYNYDIDVIICGCHKRYLQTKVNHPEIVKYRPDDKGYDLNHDTINAVNFYFVNDFYRDSLMDLSIFYDYFWLKSTELSKKLYESVKGYRIIFIQTTTSTNDRLNIAHLLKKYVDDDRTLLISINENLYDGTSYTQKQALCQPFVMEKIIHYWDTILNSDEIYIIDSCFSGIILPLLKTERLKADPVRIITRSRVQEYIL